MISLTDIFEWIWQVELQTTRVDSKPVDQLANELKEND